MPENESLDGHEQDTRIVRIAALADIHCNKHSQGNFQQLFAQISEQADVCLMCGDLTDYGLPDEAHILAREVKAALRIPVVGVLGNHDFEAGRQDEVYEILCNAGINMLDGDTATLCYIGFAGIKGFGGGFGRFVLTPWGEQSIKSFVQEAVDEALKLEAALVRLKTEHRIAVLHYSPIAATVEGEPLEIFSFLGCSRLEEPLSRHEVFAVFHGHAHSGSPEGQLSNGTPVYNVSIPVLRRAYHDQPPFRIIEVPVTQCAPEERHITVTN